MQLVTNLVVKLGTANPSRRHQNVHGGGHDSTREPPRRGGSRWFKGAFLTAVTMQEEAWKGQLGCP